MLITGASSGIGEGLARQFARRGYGLALAARRLDRLEALAPQLLAAGASQVVTIALDVADTDAIEPAVRRAASHPPQTLLAKIISSATIKSRGAPRRRCRIDMRA